MAYDHLGACLKHRRRRRSSSSKPRATRAAADDDLDDLFPVALTKKEEDLDELFPERPKLARTRS